MNLFYREWGSLLPVSNNRRYRPCLYLQWIRRWLSHWVWFDPNERQARHQLGWWYGCSQDSCDRAESRHRYRPIQGSIGFASHWLARGQNNYCAGHRLPSLHLTGFQRFGRYRYAVAAHIGALNAGLALGLVTVFRFWLNHWRCIYRHFLAKTCLCFCLHLDWWSCQSTGRSAVCAKNRVARQRF